MDCSWIAHGLLMDCSWIAHGLLMDCSWIAHGPLMREKGAMARWYSQGCLSKIAVSLGSLLTAMIYAVTLEGHLGPG
jgi:hypothetical protein